MNVLYELGMTENDIKYILDICPNIITLTDIEVHKKITILECLKCDAEEIKNIIISNPEYLLRVDSDVLLVVNRLLSLGVESLDIVIYSNPLILNKDAFEIDEYIKEKKKLNMEMDDILDLISSGMVE